MTAWLTFMKKLCAELLGGSLHQIRRLWVLVPSPTKGSLLLRISSQVLHRSHDEDDDVMEATLNLELLGR